MSSLWTLVWCAAALLDPKRLLDRASNSISEGHGFLLMYQRSVRFTREHEKLAKLMHQLGRLSKELEHMSNDVLDT
jgi:hypothetical protein